jgi:hypothetical protein
LAGVALAASSLCAMGQGTDFEQPLIQARFDHLVPTTYPTTQTNFSRLKPTTWPLIDPETRQIHITENVTQAFVRPLLITDYASTASINSTGYGVIVSASGKPAGLGSVRTSPSRTGASGAQEVAHNPP